MRYSQLRAFHNVALEGGFSRAAKALNQTQPSLSDQVRTLERDHDTLLFHRDKRQVKLTEAGRGLLLLTRQYFETEASIKEYLFQSRAEVAGTLRVFADSAMHVMPAIGRFRVAHPKVFVSLRTANTVEVLRQLRNYGADIGVVANLLPASDLDVIELGSTPIIGIAARGLLPSGIETMAFEKLPRWPLIFREQGSRTRRILEEEAARRNVALNPVIEVDGREALREVVASGAGIGFVSEAEFGHDDRLVRVPIQGIELGMTEALVTLKARRDVSVIRAFLNTFEA